MQVNAVTKSGANTPAGSLSGYFRDDSLRGADLVTHRNLPYNNQQVSGIFGGPLRKDKVHFFGHFEYEREPQAGEWLTPYPKFNITLAGGRIEKKAGGRLDAQFSPRNRMSIRQSGWWPVTRPAGAGSRTTAPSSAGGGTFTSNQVLGTLTQVLSNRSVNEVKVGFSRFAQRATKLLKNSRGFYDGTNGPNIILSGFTAGGSIMWPDYSVQDGLSFRDDLTYSFSKGGRHTMKAGAEYIHQTIDKPFCVRCDGELDASGGPIPANLESLFPDLFDATTWNLTSLSSISKTWTQAFGPIDNKIPRFTTGVWVQDDWAVTPRLTLNLGVRYDLERNAFGNDIVMLPFLAGNHDDTNNVGPRTGFTYSLNDRTVIRGGGGLYFGTVQNAHFGKFYAQAITVTVFNDGRPDFASNPFNGPAPTYESLKARLCTRALEPGCIRRDAPTGAAVYAEGFTMPYSYQAAIGLQRQLADTLGVDVDYVYNGNRDVPRDMAINLTYNQATGANYPISDISRRAYPEWGFVHLTFNGSRSNMHSLQTALTKRMSQRWQASGTYTMSMLKDAYPRPRSGITEVPFPTQPDLGGEYTLAAGDQRHRAVINGLWELPYSFQLSGLYFFGSGERRDTHWGVDLRGIGGGTRASETRLRPNGTIVPRNNFVGKPIHRVDMRIQRQFPLGGRMRIDGLLELFNVFNRANYLTFTVEEVSPSYGLPSASPARLLQLGFRLAF